MADGSKIEWTDATWNPITGCSIVSPGCTNCYAMKLAGTRLRNIPSRAGLTKATKAGPVWTGEVRFNEGWLLQPLRWKRPRRIFVCAHGDLFAENVPVEWIDKVFAIMALAPQHTFQVLTKRAERMRKYVRDSACSTIGNGDVVYRVAAAQTELGYQNVAAALRHHWPLSNVWLGVSTERQQEADDRIPDLLLTPAAVRFISAEPLIGPIDLTNIAPPDNGYGGKAHGIDALSKYNRILRGVLDWVIVGGESGHGYRPMESEWAFGIRDQCVAADVAVFIKQMAGKKPIPPGLLVRQFPNPLRVTQHH